MSSFRSKQKLTIQDAPLISHKNEIDEEQPVVDSVDITFDPNSPKSVLKNSMMREAAVTQNLSQNTMKMRKYKIDQMEDFANEYAISISESSTVSNVLSIINTTIITLALAISFLMLFGMIFGIRTCAVVTDSMETTIPVGSLVLVRDIDDQSIYEGDILSYVKSDGITYIHRVSSVYVSEESPNEYIITMTGDNQDRYPGAIDTIRSGMVQGSYIMHIPGLGNFLLWVQQSWILVLAMTITIIIAMTIVKFVYDRKHSQEVLERYIQKRDALEIRHEQRYLNYKKQQDIEELDAILNRKSE